MVCLYSDYNVNSWIFIWLNIITDWTPNCHEFDEAWSIPTSVFMTGRLLTHRCTVFSCNWKIGLQSSRNISQMVTNLGKTLITNLIGPVLNKNHIIVFWDSLSFAQKKCLKLTGQNNCDFPLIFAWRSTCVHWVEFDQSKSILELLETMPMCRISF